ncbi:MAG: ATP phosphoribosyltransferase [Bacteroidetes Order II. Incertae sedis bacterium]|nr:ATP phosphoribosyltransferase [Bacteroidetes Order II. bacterium]
MIRLAIQKSGRLSEDSLALIRECGIDLPDTKNKLRCVAHNFPVEILFLRDDDIPGYVADGTADLGIVGLNVVEETRKPVEIAEKLGFGTCRLSIAVPKTFEWTGLEALNGRRIATSYPNVLQDFLKNAGISASIHEISGSVEIAPGIGLADAICDLVSSGGTLLSNGLKEVQAILQSEAVIIRHAALSSEKTELLDQLKFRIRSVHRARNFKYILLNAPNEQVPEVIRLLPGMKSPTVLPLALSGWSSVHSVIQEDQFWEIIEGLKAAGAQGILVVPIEKMIL